MLKRLLLSSSLLITATGLFAGERILQGSQATHVFANSNLVRFTDQSTFPNFIGFKPNEGPAANEAVNWVLTKLKDPNFDFQAKSTTEDVLGFSHFNYQQTYKGYPIEFGALRIHAKQGITESVNGVVVTASPKNSHPAMSETAALAKALAYMNAQTYKWEIADLEAFIQEETGDVHATFYPKGELVYVPFQADFKRNDLRLAYKFNVYAHVPLKREMVYVDATTGEIVFANNLLLHANAQGTAVTKYSGTNPIVTDSVSPTNFRLREAGRGNGIFTYNCQTSTSYSNTDFTDTDNFWNNVNANQDEVATDAHWGAEMTYDYFQQEHNRNSIDNNGFALRSYVHYDLNYANAFWDGQRMTYGDGNGQLSPLTALDITGHEITHGLTEFTANLIYQDESGALNESFSDVFGVSIEWFAKPNQANWLMGENIGSVIRSMSNPAQYGDPDTYGGINWYTGSADNGGVHTNSGVQNKWYHLMCVGGNGFNDNGHQFSVTGLGVANAAKIPFRSLTIYLTSTSDYADARFYAIRSAQDLFGGCSPEVQTTTNAWYAVGVGPEYVNYALADFEADIVSSCSVPVTVNFANNSINGNTFSWSFGNGQTSTQVTPTTTYNAFGTYSVTLTLDGGANCGMDTIVKTNYIVIDPSEPCATVMNASGISPTQTSCNGILYDAGGPSGNYGDNLTSTITIAPSGATSLSLSFVEFDVEAGSGNTCDYDYVEIFNGSTTNEPSLGKFCNTNGSPGTVIGSTGALTIKLFADQGVNGSGFKANWSCVFPTVPPVANFTSDVSFTCIGHVAFSDASTNGPNQWLWDFGDGTTSTLQHPTHYYTNDGNYTVSLTVTNSYGNDVETKQNMIFVDKPAMPTGEGGGIICYNSPATLTANGSGDLAWFDAATGGNQVGSGNSYTIPAVTFNQSIYAENQIPGATSNVGALDNTIGGGGNFNFSQYLIFDALDNFILKSVYIYAAADGDREIEWRDASGNVLDSRTVFVTAGGARVQVDFNITPGTDYQLGPAPGSTINMYRNNSGTNYPYTIPGIVSITKSSANNATALYYFYYDWEVQEKPCASTRLEYELFIDPCNSVQEVADALATAIYPNPSEANFTVSVTTSEAQNAQVLLVDVNGRVVFSAQKHLAQGASTFTVDGNTLASGIYFLSIATPNATVYKKITKL